MMLLGDIIFDMRKWKISSEVLEVVDFKQTGWRDRARCIGKETRWFYPERGGATKECKDFCSGCEVRNECFSFAIFHIEKHGIWGGTSERERRKYRKELAAQGYRFDYQKETDDSW